MTFRYIDPRTNPDYKYDIVLGDINYNFSLLSGVTTGATSGNFLPLSGGTVTGNTIFTARVTADTLTLINTANTDSFQVFDEANIKQLYIDNTNQLAFYTGLSGGPIYFGAFDNPTAGLAGFSVPGEVISAVSSNTKRFGFGGGGAYFAVSDPKGLVEIRGRTDEVQLIVQANSAQNSNLIEVRDALENPLLVIDGLGRFSATTISATTLSAGTIYSASTNLYDIFASTTSISKIQPGINTYTGGTEFLPTVNVSALTINTLITSGNTSLQNVTGLTFSATSYSAGTITLTDKIAPTNPTSGNIIIQSFNQQGFSVPHIYDSSGNAIEITRDSISIVRNNTGSALTKGQVVYITGSTGTVPTIALSISNSLTALPAVGILYENINNNAFGRMMIIGNLENINLSSFNTGDLLYVSPTTPGALTNIRPSYPNYAQSIGTVLSNGVGNGALQVFIRVLEGIKNGDSAVLNSVTASTFSNGSQTLSTEKINFTGTTNLSGVNVSSFVDTGTTRMVETNSGGTLSATRQIVSAFGLPSSAMTALSLAANWDNNGLYTGTTIDSTYQGQEYYDSAYYYRAVSDNYFIRLIRG